MNAMFMDEPLDGKPDADIDANVYGQSNLRDRRTEALTVTQMFIDGRTEGRKTGRLYRHKCLWSDEPWDGKPDAYIDAKVYGRTEGRKIGRIHRRKCLWTDQLRDAKLDAYIGRKCLWTDKPRDEKPDAYIDANIYGRLNRGTENRTPTSTHMFMDGRTEGRKTGRIHRRKCDGRTDRKTKTGRLHRRKCYRRTNRRTENRTPI